MSHPEVLLAYEHPLPDIFSADKLQEQSAVVTLPYGKLEVRRWFFDGIRINHYKNYFRDRFCFEKQNADQIVSLSFNLKGAYVIRQSGHTYTVKRGQHNIVHTKGYSNTFENQELQGESFSIEWEPEAFYRLAKDGNDTLKQFLLKMQKDEPAVLSPTSLFIHPDLHTAIQSILTCAYSGHMKKLFLLSKCVEILVMQAEAYDQSLRRENIFYKKKDDQDRLVYARQILQEKMENPPTLSELSKIIGINEYKLKRGFRELFGVTVFGYLSDFRLERAKEELQDSGKSIGEIAYLLGYYSPQHFANAFRKKFGISPSEFRK
ncbi:AraC family transcriptional regulator [Fulvivirgaceae bacterium BMA12]|uniref:AraC family transcriptional regulator n=1 Tax=Agaribacillus aureus TaxID=3051825 RepID=A0ABT8LAS2_9BACT|nr:AraC family transcriptional regulator [Fulvivirgaceae bacterium BMA12]